MVGVFLSGLPEACFRRFNKGDILPNSLICWQTNPDKASPDDHDIFGVFHLGKIFPKYHPS